MRLGVISDIHGNKPAFEAVLSELTDVQAIVNAGDVVGYNPWPGACIELVRDHDIVSVSGNHDRAVAAGSTFRFNSLAKAGVEYAQTQLSAEQLTWLDELPEQRRVDGDTVRIVHGHPDDPDRYTYPEEFSPTLLDGESVLVLGHTHIQHAEEYEEGIVVNPGSVGQPRDGDPRAAYAIVDTETQEVDLNRVGYDIGAVEEAVAAAGLPREIATRLQDGR